MGNVTRDIFEIAGLLIGVAAVALLVSQSRGTATVVESVGGTFNQLLRTVTLQSQYGNAFGGFGN